MSGLLRRIRAAVALGVVATLGAIVWGEATRPAPTAAPKSGPRPAVTAEVASARFARQPVVAYDDPAGTSYLALQLQPKLDPVGKRPLDIVLMIDTSASQSGTPLRVARELAAALAQSLKGDDRVSLRLANIPHDQATRSLTGGLLSASEPKFRARLKDLEQEYASGAVDLKFALRGALKDFDGKQSRQQVIVYLGDAESAYAPLTEKDRFALAREMLDARVAFFAVPLGARVDAANMHSFVSGTGGAVVRYGDDVANAANPSLTLVSRLLESVAVPTLSEGSIALDLPGAEILPSKLPVVRADVPALVLVKYKGKAASLKATLTGKVAGKPTEIVVKHDMPVALADNYFLSGLYGQWKNSGTPDAPALLRADRTLGLAYEQHRLVLEECVAQAGMALNAYQFDAAKDLFKTALKIDPRMGEAAAGLKVVDEYKTGRMSKEEMAKFLKTAQEVPQAVDPKDAPPKKDDPLAPPVVAPPIAPVAPVAPTANFLKEEEARLAVVERQFAGIVDETLNRARQLLREGDPEAAKQQAVQIRDQVQLQSELSTQARSRLLQRTEALLREIGTSGARIRQQVSEEREREARARSRISAVETQVAREESIRDRVRALSELMRQARFEEAYREAELMRQEQIVTAQPVPPQTTALYHMGQVATNLREARELVRLREDRFLLTMLQVEKSHVPYPDEPPVHFPPARVWRDLTIGRQPFATTDLDPGTSRRVRNRMEFLRRSLEEPNRDDKAHEAIPLKDMLNILSEINSPAEAQGDPSQRLRILVDEVAFRGQGDDGGSINDKKVNVPNLSGASLATVLRVISDQLGGTYIVRQDYIELTSREKALREKVVRAFPVVDLVTPLPNAIAQNSLQQNLQVLGSTFSLGGNPNSSAFGFAGGFGGGFGNNVQQQQQNGGQGGNNPANGLFQGNPANNNQGAGGGVQGFSGGQLGQFGNLGGQFGFQGGNQSTLLVQLIKDVVASGEWKNTAQVLGGAAPATTVDDPTFAGGEGGIPEDQKNSLGYYTPAGALVLRASSRFHKNVDSRLAPKPAGGLGNAGKQNGDRLVMATPANVKKVVDRLKLDPVERAKLAKDVDPKKAWQEALAQTRKEGEPGAIIACVDFLAQIREFKHAAELLKASLREGVTPAPWAQDALAIALEASQGSPVEIERARVSGIDLEPKDPQAYLRASKALAELGRREQAIALCRFSAKLQPDLPDPYLNAMVYAKELNQTDSDTSIWAADNLLKRDWPLDAKEYHAQARQHLDEVLAQAKAAKNTAEVTKVKNALEVDGHRDLVVKLMYAGPAGLDLKVTEPSGSICSALQRQTAGGGILQGDDLSQREDNRSQTYAAAQAFDGSYTVEIDRVYGRPVGNKATLQITRHAGSPEQATELVTVSLDKNHPVKVQLTGGRRTSLVYVPAPTVAPDSLRRPERTKQVMAKLHAMTDPLAGGGMHGGASSGSQALTGHATQAPQSPAGHLSYTSRLDSPIGMEMTATVNTGSKEVTLTPVFQTAAHQEAVRVTVVPGADS